MFKRKLVLSMAVCFAALYLFTPLTVMAASAPASANVSSAKGAILPGQGACVSPACIVVGPFDASNECDALAVASALTTAAAEVRLVGAPNGSGPRLHQENIVIADRDLRIIGGYQSCLDARNGTLVAGIGNPHTIIRSPFNVGPIIRAEQNAPSLSQLNVDLYYLNIENATVVTGTTGGVSVDVVDGLTPNLQVSLHYSEIKNNASNVGGGVNVDRADLLIGNGVRINNNTANANGGGVWCRDGYVIQANDSIQTGIFSNIANFGAGVYLDNCVLSWSRGTNGEDLSNGISGNSAKRGGGGIYATGGNSLVSLGFDAPDSYVLMYRNSVNNILIDGNYPDSVGGGAIQAENGARIYLARVDLRENSAGNPNFATLNTGGAIRVNNASLSISPPPGGECVNNQCIKLRENYSKGSGAAIYSVNSLALLIGADVHNNSAGDGAIVHHVGGGPADHLIRNSYIRNNYFNLASPSSRYAVTLSGATATISNSTIVDNRLGAFSGPSAIVNVETGGVEVRASILTETDTALAGSLAFLTDSGPGSITGSCVQTHDASFTDTNFPSVSKKTLIQPEFVNAAIGDYHLLNANSNFAVDFCDSASATSTIFGSTNVDYDNQGRNIDIPTISNIHGPIDLGADEVLVDALFNDGFEG